MKKYNCGLSKENYKTLQDKVKDKLSKNAFAKKSQFDDWLGQLIEILWTLDDSSLKNFNFLLRSLLFECENPNDLESLFQCKNPEEFAIKYLQMTRNSLSPSHKTMSPEFVANLVPNWIFEINESSCSI